jgi:hypothetical protein
MQPQLGDEPFFNVNPRTIFAAPHAHRQSHTASRRFFRLGALLMTVHLPKIRPVKFSTCGFTLQLYAISWRSKQRPADVRENERLAPAKKAEFLLWGILATIITGFVTAGWFVREYIDNNLASKAGLVIVEIKADFVLDQQMSALISQASYLERIRNKTADEISQLNYLREQLALMRRVRMGK